DGHNVEQLTHTVNPDALGNWDGNLGAGGRVVFTSDLDLVGENPDANGEIFTMQVDGSDLKQVTHTTSGGCLAPHLSANGETMTFRCFNDLVGANPDLSSEVFRMGFDGSNLVQVTACNPQGVSLTTGISGPWDISPDGKTIVIHSDQDLVPGNNT